MGSATERSTDVLVRNPRADNKHLNFEYGRAWLHCCGRGRPHSVQWSHAARFSSFESPYVVSCYENDGSSVKSFPGPQNQIRPSALFHSRAPAPTCDNLRRAETRTE